MGQVIAKALAALVVSGLILFGCSSDSESGSEDTTTTASDAQSPTTSEEESATTETDSGASSAPTEEDYEQLLADLAATTEYCEAVDVFNQFMSGADVDSFTAEDTEALLLVVTEVLDRYAALAPDEIADDYEVLVDAQPDVIQEAEEAGYDPEVVFGSGFPSVYEQPEVAEANAATAGYDNIECFGGPGDATTGDG